MATEDVIRQIRFPVLNKQQALDLAMCGAFGNNSRNWQSVEEARSSGYTGRIAIRYREGGRPWCRYRVNLENVGPIIDAWVKEDADPALFYFTEMVQDGGLTVTMQGEVRYDAGEWSLLYSTTNAPMRDALAQRSEEVHGWRARELVRAYMDPSSFEDLMVIQDLWPDHVVEFTCFNKPVGLLADRFCRQVIFWEVRYY